MDTPVLTLKGERDGTAEDPVRDGSTQSLFMYVPENHPDHSRGDIVNHEA